MASSARSRPMDRGKSLGSTSAGDDSDTDLGLAEDRLLGLQVHLFGHHEGQHLGTRVTDRFHRLRGPTTFSSLYWETIPLNAIRACSLSAPIAASRCSPPTLSKKTSMPSGAACASC